MHQQMARRTRVGTFCAQSRGGAILRPEAGRPTLSFRSRIEKIADEHSTQRNALYCLKKVMRAEVSMEHVDKPGHHHDDDDLPSDVALRVKALESLLVEKGLVDPAALDAIIEFYEHKVGPHIGAGVIARAWVDQDYKARLRADGTAAIGELGIAGPQGAHIIVVENTPSVHNLVVCTLCSCYPSAVLGLPPVWYKSAPYRSRAVIDPRGVLQELGLDLPEDIEIRVWDSTAEVRYLVMPQRPPGTENLNESELAALISRDAMVGVAQPRFVEPPA
jgi:nitrile hydratase subunit alpha